MFFQGQDTWFSTKAKLSDRAFAFLTSQLFDRYFASFPGIHISQLSLAAEYAHELTQAATGLTPDESAIFQYAALFYLTFYFYQSPVDRAKVADLFKTFLQDHQIDDLLALKWVDYLRVPQPMDPVHAFFEKKLEEKAKLGTERTARVKQYEKLLRKYPINRQYPASEKHSDCIVQFPDAATCFAFQKFIAAELTVPPYCNQVNHTITLSYDQYKNLKNSYRRIAPARLPEEKFIIKTVATYHHELPLRGATNFDYFHQTALSLTRSDKQNKKFHYRRAGKGKFVVKGDGVHDRKTKKPQYTPQEKGYRSQPQSVSWELRDIGSPAYGGMMRDVRKVKSTGVKLGRKDVLPTYFSLYDGGTVGGPNRFSNEEDAKVWYERKTKGIFFSDGMSGEKRYLSKPVLFPNEETFMRALRDLSPEEKIKQHNEVLSRIQFNHDGTSEVCIFSEDDLDADPNKIFSAQAAWCAIDRKRILLNRCIARANENKTIWNDDVDIPIAVYKRNASCIPRLETFDLFDQVESKWEAKKIYANKKARIKCYHEQQYEFLLALEHPDPVELLMESIPPLSRWDFSGDQSLIMKLLNDGYVHIVVSLLEQATPEQLEKFNQFKPIMSTRVNRTSTHIIDLAVKTGYTPLVEWLLKRKQLEFSTAALVSAAENQYHDIVKMLVDKDAFLAAQDPQFFGLTPFHWTLFNQDKELFDYFMSLPKGKIEVILEGTDEKDRTPIEFAAHLEYWDIVKTLLEKIKPDGLIHWDFAHLGRTLTKAVAAGKSDIVALLLAKGAPVRAGGYDRETNFNALHWAIKNKDMPMLNQLLDADLKHPNRLASLYAEVADNGLTPIAYAASLKEWDTVKQLASRKKSNFKDKAHYGDALLQAVKQKQTDVIECLLDQKAPIKAKYYDQDGNNILHLAIVNGDLLFVKRLLKLSSDVSNLLEKVNKASETPMVLAAKLGHWEIVKAILDKKPQEKSESFGYDYRTAILYAAKANQTEIVKRLFKSGCFKSSYYIDRSKDTQCYNILHWAIHHQNDELIRFYMANVKEKHASLFTSTNLRGQTVVEFAAHLEYWDRVSTLIRCRKTDEYDEAHYGKVLLAAVSKEKTEIVRLLLKANTPFKQKNKDSNGDTLLHLAIKHPNALSVKTVLRRIKGVGGFLKVENNQRLTPMALAVSLGQWDTVVMLAKSKKIKRRLDDYGYGDALTAAVAAKQPKAIEALLNNKAPVGSMHVDQTGCTALHWAIQQQNNRLVGKLLHRAGPSMPFLLAKANHQGKIPIEVAAECNNWDAVLQILKKSKSNQVEKGIEILHWAVKAFDGSAKMTTIIRTLIKLKVSPDAIHQGKNAKDLSQDLTLALNNEHRKKLHRLLTQSATHQNGFTFFQSKPVAKATQQPIAQPIAQP